MTVKLDNHHHIHFVGIAGIGMSALARFLHARGFLVSGSDRHPGEQGDALRDLGIQVSAGHASDNLAGADLVVITSAVGADNPEVAAAKERGVPVIKRSELLAAVTNGARGVAVAGSHGKTTTTALLGWILIEAGLDPTILVGGMMSNLGSNARVGQSDLVVVEADEYDGSFLRLRPSIAVVTNAEPEHLDFYGTPERMFEAYQRFAASVTERLVLCADDLHAEYITRNACAPVATYGLEHGDTRISGTADRGGMMHFLLEDGDGTERYASPLPGTHNALNATAAILVARYLGVPADTVRDALLTFRGAERRTEIKGEANGILVLDDYGHHPTEIASTLQAVRGRFNRPIRLIFQPHTYSRTAAFFDDFASAFSDADALYLLDIYAARETDTLGMSGRLLARAVEQHHGRVMYLEDGESAVRTVAEDARPGDLVVTMGAGDVYQLGPRILAKVAGR